jgi:hypothetical protein
MRYLVFSCRHKPRLFARHQSDPCLRGFFHFEAEPPSIRRPSSMDVNSLLCCHTETRIGVRQMGTGRRLSGLVPISNCWISLLVNTGQESQQSDPILSGQESVSKCVTVVRACCNVESDGSSKSTVYKYTLRVFTSLSKKTRSLGSSPFVSRSSAPSLVSTRLLSYIRPIYLRLRVDLQVARLLAFQST